MLKFMKKSKIFIIYFLCFALLSCFFYSIVERCVSKFNGFTIVIDAGHGGRDGGSVGVAGTVEKEINLDYSLSLKDKLVSLGFKVVMTRTNDDGLYSAFDRNKKSSDMKERLRIIKLANPNIRSRY